RRGDGQVAACIGARERMDSEGEPLPTRLERKGTNAVLRCSKAEMVAVLSASRSSAATGR
ncbi:MAG: hypothetical protein ACM3ZE_05880, partial [Myxococcales bacterium]